MGYPDFLRRCMGDCRPLPQPPKHPTVWKGSVLSRLACLSGKAVYLDVETRAHGEQEISATELSTSLASFRSSGGMYSRGSDRLLALMTSFSFSRSTGLLILCSSLTPASRTLHHLRLPLQLAEAESSSVILRECTALGRLKQLGSLVLACPLATPFYRNRVDTESVPLLDSPITPSSLRGLFPMCSNASTWIIDDDGFRNSVRWGRLGQDGFDSCLAPMDRYPKSQLMTIVIVGARPGPNAVKALLEIDLASTAPNLERVKATRLRWPVTRHEIETSGWVPLAEALCERFEVKLVDPVGHPWTPGLKV
ncbi:hypothetical protein BKA70DRAFT_1342128 [Coprinopsis sp. MPI-PUGE-AT-0042]|nr:hypothetical protein BKA70DRAFT_1342128 [Coprinopsis sp. MPI-PUGE-AT-0042]